MSYPPQGNKANVGTIGTDVTTLLARLTSARAGYLDALNRNRPDMVFPSLASDAACPIVVLPAVAADLAFPSVVVAGLPSGLSIKRADFVLAIGGLLDTSTAENQVDQAAKTIRVKGSAAAWAAAIIALTFGNLALQTGESAYRGGPVLFGGIDIKAIVTGNGTYNFQSDEAVHSEGVTVTGANLEALDVFSIIRVWFN